MIHAWHDAFGLLVHDGYGQTETTLLAANVPGLPIRPGSMGKPFPGHDLCVIDEQGGGVGGLAAAVAAYSHQRLADAPKIVIVEPERAACLFASAGAGRPVTIPHGEPTVMAMLECATPSPIAFEVLLHLTDGYVTLREEEAISTMRRLANPLGADTPIVSGESGCTGLAGLFATQPPIAERVSRLRGLDPAWKERLRAA